MENKNILEVVNVSKRYSQKKVLNDVNLSVKKGEIIGLVGPNGAGKTTLMSIIVGLINNYEGDIYIDGENIRKIKKKKQKQKLTGCIIETPGFYPHLTGYENLKLLSMYYGKVSKQEILDVISLLELENAMKKKVSKYSMGMKQRLGIAQTVLGNPKILVLDEPTNGLDPTIIPKIRDFIRYYAKEKNISTFISSHILSEIETICEKVLFLKNGVIVDRIDLENERNSKRKMFIFKTNKAEKLFEFFKSKNIFSKINEENRVIASLEEKDIELLIPEILSSGIVITEMKEYMEKLEDRFLRKMEGNLVD
ncbi:ABC transporter ATP-binding protein [Tepiditoga spiralis]|uniref:ABC transporter ATP-binding protein n=1 Tax=Tepiditoga spiralis TaxID=2108365 RepID=A0A7G1GAU4_9BACT|nr:ABC transporter ATP-binding protein [Tepiditoga spiralis]BBE30669.1 ABC transporter ATP-binding protein [Tepiditoga spiralis]